MLEASDPNGTSTPTQGHNGRKELRDQRGVRVIGVKTSVLVGELDIHGMLRQYVTRQDVNMYITITYKTNQKNVVYIAKSLKRLRTRPSGVVSHHRMGARTTPQFVGISLVLDVLDVLVSWVLLISFDGHKKPEGRKWYSICYLYWLRPAFASEVRKANRSKSCCPPLTVATEMVNPRGGWPNQIRKMLVMFQEIRDFVPHACFLKLLPPKNRWSFFSIS